MSDASQTNSRPALSIDQIRFEATVHAVSGRVPPDVVRHLDTLPDASGAVRVLIGMQEAADLTLSGYEVHLLHAHPIAPLDPARIIDEKQFSDWIQKQRDRIQQQGG